MNSSTPQRPAAGDRLKTGEYIGYALEFLLRPGCPSTNFRRGRLAAGRRLHVARRDSLRTACGQQVMVGEGDTGLVVRSAVARRQIEAETASTGAAPTATGTPGPGGTSSASPTDTPPATGSGAVTAPQAPPKLRRFHGSIALDATRVGRDAAKIAEEVIQHLVGIMGAEVEVKLEIQTRIPDGVPDNVIRTVTENCRTLKFDSSSFEEE